MYLRNAKGFKWSRKRVYRIYKQLELNLRIKPRRRIKRDKPGDLSVPLSINQTWSIDFTPLKKRERHWIGCQIH